MLKCDNIPVSQYVTFSDMRAFPSLPHTPSSPVLPSECEASEDSSGEAELEAELEAEPETSDLEDLRELHPGALLYRASRARNLPVMAEALAHGADVNAASGEDEGKTPLIQAVTGVSREPSLAPPIRLSSHIRCADSASERYRWYVTPPGVSVVSRYKPFSKAGRVHLDV